MKKTFTYLRTLLVGLMAVTATGTAWADSKITFYSNDFSAEKSLELISVSASANQNLSLKTDENEKYGQYVNQTTQDRARDVYMDVSTLLSASFANYTDYTVEFDAAFRSGATNRTAGNSLTLKSTGSKDIFKMATPTAQVSGGDLVFTVEGAEEGKEITLKSLTWYHFKFEITSTSVTYTVTLGSDDSDITNGSGTRTITDSRIKQIFFGTARSTGQTSFDNIDIYAMAAGDVANDPIITESAVVGENREYTISFGEGETLYYTLPGGSEETATTSPVVLTATEAGTLSAYTKKGSATSTTVNATVTHGTVSLNNPTYKLSSIAENYGKTYTININNSDIELMPTASMTYVFTPAGGSAESPVNIANGGTINSTQEGTYVITATADGYTSSELTIKNDQAYIKSKTYDFSAMTTSDLDMSTPKWTGPAETNYQTGSSTTLYSGDGYTVISEYASNSAIEGVNLNSSAVLLMSYGLYPNGNNGGFSLSGLSKDDIVLWTYLDYSTETESVMSYNSVFKGNNNHYRYLIKKVEVYSPTTISATIGEEGWATLYTDYALDFSGVDGLTAYTATCNGATVTLYEVEDVPAGTGVVLKGDADTYNIPVIASSETAKGDLQGAATATAYNAFSGYDLYVLTKSGDSDAQFARVKSGEIAAGKAFLKVADNSKSRLNVVMAGETTGIKAIEAAEAEEGIYNLQGQRVAKAQKGLYIVNGKKAIVK